MKVYLIALLAVGLYALVLYAVAGRWVAVQARADEKKTDRILLRALKRTSLLYRLGSVLVLIAAIAIAPDFARLPEVGLIYAGPLFWLWAMVLGASWLELRARGLESGLWRFHRFNLFSGFLLWGQRIPFYSAALAAPRDLSAGTPLFVGIGLHVGLAIVIGYLLRVIVRGRVVSDRPFPDQSLLDSLMETAREEGIRFRGVYLVETEKGQSVNAFAATSSRKIYVAKGLYEGLGRDEVKAVLLHELGHLRQILVSAFRNVAVLGYPAMVWLLLVVAFSTGEPGLGLSVPGLIGLTLALALGGRLLARRVYRAAERRADLFAARWGASEALASSLRKMYALNLASSIEGGRVHPALAERLRILGEMTKGVQAPSA